MKDYLNAVKEIRENKEKVERLEGKVEEIIIEKVKEIVGEELTDFIEYDTFDDSITVLILNFGLWKEIEIILNEDYIFESFIITRFEEERKEEIRRELRKITQMRIR